MPTPQERIECLLRLYTETGGDGMVALEIGREYRSQNQQKKALEYFEEAERKFPISEWKGIARKEAEDVRKQLEAVAKPLEVKPSRHDPETTLFIVACTKNKIWNEEPDAPTYVPALRAYCGKNFKKFVRMLRASEYKMFKWLILSAKYGYIEPWHPIGNYDVTFNDENTGPISDDTLYSQVMHQRRWRDTTPLKNFKTIICFGSQPYLERVRRSFRDTGAQVIDGSTL